MAIPGYSVGDVIRAATALKDVYDAFFSKYDNAHNRVTELHNMVNLFHSNLLAHSDILQRSGKHYPGFEDFESTITECNDFLQKYVRRLTAAGGGGRGKIRAMVNTAAWSLEERQVDKLTRRLLLQIQALNSFALTVLLEKLSHGDEEPHVATEVYEPGDGQAQFPPLHVIKQNLLTGRTPLSLHDSPESSVTDGDETLQQLMVRAMVSRNHRKRREIESLQRSRNNSKRSSADNRQLTLVRAQYHEEAQLIVRDWRRIALRNGLSAQSLPQISSAQPLETAEEHWKRALHASQIASKTPLSPMGSPRPADHDDGFPSPNSPQPVTINSPELRPESASMLSASPPDTIFTHRTKGSSATVTPNSLGLLDPRRRPSSFVGSISLGLPAVIDCSAELTLRHRTAHYPALKIKRIELHQLDGSCDVYCTTIKDLRIVHKIPRGHGTHPFTKHSCHSRPLEVNFLESHKVVHDHKTYSGDPHYKFFTEEDCKLFQGSIHGKDLVITYDVDKISFKTSDHLGDATDQHLKIWRNFDGGEFSLTFFANNPSDSKGRRHREFKLTELILAGGGKAKSGVVKLDFKAAQIVPTQRRSKPVVVSSNAASSAGGGGVSPNDFGERGFVDKAAGPDTPSTTSDRPRLPSRTARLSMTLASSTPRLNVDSPSAPKSPGFVSPFGSIGRSKTAETASPVEDALAQLSINEDEDEVSRLKFMEITFSEHKFAEKFINLFNSVQHL